MMQAEVDTLITSHKTALRCNMFAQLGILAISKVFEGRASSRSRMNARRYAKDPLIEQKHQSVAFIDVSFAGNAKKVEKKKSHNDIDQLVGNYSLTLSVELHLKFVNHLSGVLRCVIHGVSSGGDLAKTG